MNKKITSRASTGKFRTTARKASSKTPAVPREANSGKMAAVTIPAMSPDGAAGDVTAQFRGGDSSSPLKAKRVLVKRKASKPDAIATRAGAQEPEDPWVSIDALTDKDIEQAVDKDPDAAPISDQEFWKGAKLIERIPKQAISIRLDKDIIDWFKAQGKGYQGRVNAVLKTYMVAHRDDA